MSALVGFRKRMTETVEPRGFTVSTWSAGGRNSRNLVKISTTPKQTVLYVKEFNVTGRRGFWGFTRNQVTCLENANVEWFTVLLLGRPDKTGGDAYATFSQVSLSRTAPEYHRSNVPRRSPLSSRVRTCNSRWAPRRLHRICCFLTIRLLMT